jgi:hypothetical protein
MANTERQLILSSALIAYVLRIGDRVAIGLVSGREIRLEVGDDEYESLKNALRRQDSMFTLKNFGGLRIKSVEDCPISAPAATIESDDN